MHFAADFWPHHAQLICMHATAQQHLQIVTLPHFPADPYSTSRTVSRSDSSSE